jgi:hypothetical protein
MQATRLLLIPLSVMIASCGSAGPDPVLVRPNVAAPPAAAGFQLSPAQKATIGRKIWQNESGGTTKGLTHWNEGEEFPSLGIGHFIWYPKGFNGRWTETFPEFIRFAQVRGIRDIPPTALLPDCPWKSMAEFYGDFDGPRLSGMRTWLAANVPLQTDFIMWKSRAALPAILKAARADQRDRIQANYDKVATTPNGVYALIDYVNFKGAGTNPRERYKGQGWGLMWVLMEMKDVSPGPAAAREFGAAAARCLDRRIANSDPARGEQRWRAGWRNRCLAYGNPL